jgi:feruloyl esterase
MIERVKNLGGCLKGAGFLMLSAAIGCTAVPAFAASCESLASLSLPNTTVTLAQLVPAGAFSPPAPEGRGGRGGPNYKDLPAFCRVLATARPTGDSEIKIEVWMPAENWNGKFEGTANGNWAGNIGRAALAGALRRGYAAAATDTGHEGGGATFVQGHPEKLIDFQYRGIHEMTTDGKLIVNAFYANPLRYSYFVGCSTGGKQALKEAQRFPADYDGIVSGDPANFTTHMAIQQVGIALAVHKDQASEIPAEKYPLIHKAALDACDALDGVTDGVIENPMRCKFDPKVLECQAADSPSCLTAPQVEAARKIYAPAKNSRTGKEIFPGLEPGSEMGWDGLAGKDAFDYATNWLRYGVFKDPKWDYKTLNFDGDVTLSEKAGGDAEDANDPNIKPFISRGGKLLMYHGWADPLIAPRNTVEYYQAVLAKLDSVKNVRDSVKLFMVPGMLHCGGGDGPNTFDTLTALEQWRENGKGPEKITASHMNGGAVDRTRPLCPFPQVAAYKGSGSTDQAENFVCAAPVRN